MELETITIPLDTETARIYNGASEEDQRKIQLLMKLFLRDFVGLARSLNEIMDEIGQKAEERGLTPEILEQLLKDE